MKNCQNPTTPINQSTILPPSLEDTSLPLFRIRGIAELFSPNEGSEEIKQLGSEACTGIFFPLKEAAYKIDAIVNSVIDRRYAEKKGRAEARERQAQKLYDIRCGEVAHDSI